MSWDKVVLTKSGEELLSGMLSGAKLIITRAAVGGETVDDGQLAEQTNVASPLSASALIGGWENAAGENGTQIDILITNEGVLETSRMKQVGIFAKTENRAEVLFGILQDETGEEIPPYNSLPEWLIRMSIVIGISRTDNIEVVISPHIFAEKAELDALKKVLSRYGYVVAETSERDPDLPTYGLDDSGGGVRAVLRASAYTGTADITLFLETGEKFDAENVKADESDAVKGDLIVNVN